MTTSAAQAATFYSEVLEHDEVWSIRDEEGFPSPLNQDGQRSIPFWSRRSRAEIVLKVPAFDGFSITSISLNVWRERWLPGLERDGILVGLNWAGPRASGYDIEPRTVESNLAARDAS